MLPRAAALAASVLLWAQAGVCWAQASAPSIPFRSAVAGESPAPQQWLVAVLGGALLLGGLLYLLRRFGGRLPRLAATPHRHLKVLERTGLANGVQLVVVEYDQRRLLLAVSATGAVSLRDDPLAEAPLPPLDGAKP